MANKLIHHFLENSAVRFPDKVAIIHDQTRATYRQVNTDADSLASFLIGRGVEKGDRVVILMENSYEYVVAYYAILKAGAVAVPLSTGLKPDGLNPLLAELEPVAIISSSRFERLLQASNLNVPGLNTLIIHNPKLDWSGIFDAVFPFQLPANHPQPTTNHQICPADLGSIIYTSGSTGTPKGAMLSHGNIVANTMAIVEYQQLTDKDIHMVVLPFFYVMGKSLLNTHVAAGGTVVINNRFAYPAAVLNQMVEEQVTGFSGVPSTFAFLLHRSPLRDYRGRLPALRFCAQAGGHLARKLKVKLREALPDHTRLFIMYGATEGGARFAYLDPDRFTDKIESIGKPLDNVRISILDEQDREVPQGQVGELNASGPNVMSGYWRDVEASAGVLGPYGYRTGDMGYMDDEGYLFITGRKDDTLKVGGHRINTQHVEEMLLETGLLVQAAVIGVDDKLLGKQLRAMVVYLDESAADQELLRKRCAATMPAYAIPSIFLAVKSIPTNANGKTDRLRCLQMIGSASA